MIGFASTKFRRTMCGDQARHLNRNTPQAHRRHRRSRKEITELEGILADPKKIDRSSSMN
jgi:hypothetical protein